MNNDKKDEGLVNNLEGYKLLYHLENLIREWLHKTLINNLGDNYFGKGVFIIEIKLKPVDLFEIAKNRKDIDIKNKVVGVDKLPLIYFLDLWQLGEIITLKWNDLYSFFPGKWTEKELKSRFSMLNGPRNRIAHSQSIREVEVNLLKEMLDFFLRNISDKSIEQLESIYLQNIDKKSTKDKKCISEIISALKKSAKLPKGFETHISGMKVNNLQNKNFVDFIEDIENDLLKYDRKRDIIGGFDKAQKYIQTSGLLGKLEQLLEKVM